MPRSYLDQALQIAASASYDDAIASANTSGVAEAQTTLEGDNNVTRTLMRNLLGGDHFWEVPARTLKQVNEKVIKDRKQPSSFLDVNIAAANNSTAFDIPIKGIVGHADGDGSSTVLGVILNATFMHRLLIRDHDSQNAYDDGSGNEVYGRLLHSDTPVESGDNNNQISDYANIIGVTDDNTDTEKALHFSIVDDTGGFFHIDIYKELARTNLVGHTGTYNATGAQSVVADNASGLGGTVTVDAVTAVDVDIKVIFGQYTINWYSWIAGVETAYAFTVTKDVDLMYVFLSREMKDLGWDSPVDPSFHDAAGFTGSVADDNVVVDGMADLLVGLTTQAQVNAKLDDLGSTANGVGAALVAGEDASGYYTGGDLEAWFNELEAQIGGLTSTTFGFAENNVLADNDDLYAALEKFDLRWGDLAATGAGEGANDVGYDNTASGLTAANVKAALDEIVVDIAAISPVKTNETTVGVINSGVSHTLPGSLSFTPEATYGANLKVWFKGQLLMPGAGNDYTEDAGAPSTQIKFLFTVPANQNLQYEAIK